MGDEADGVGADGAGQDVLLFECGAEGGGVSVAGEGEDDDVGLDGFEINGGAGVGSDGFREEAGVGVVLGEEGGGLFEGDEAGCGDDAGLAHASAEGLAVDAGLFDVLSGADEDGADGGSEAFGEAEVYGVEAAGELGHGEIEGRGGVEDAGSVEVDGEAGFGGSGPDLLHGGERGDGAAGHVVGVFEADEGGLGAVVDLRADGGGDDGPGEDAAFGGDGAALAAGEGGGHGHLPVEDVGAGLADDLLAVLGVDADGDLVAHGAGGDEDGGLFAEDGGGRLFELIDGGVFAVDVVADLGGGHGLAHGGGGAGDGVAAEVDEVGHGW